MKKSFIKVVVVLSFGIMPFLGYAEVPGTISYQGYLSRCRICIYYADNHGRTSHRMMCTKLVHGADSGNITLAGDVDGNDILRMSFRCDGGSSGSWNSWNH